jgi:hypothetical protein
MATIKNPMNSSNPWSAGFSNLGLALFGDPSSPAAKNAALDTYRQAETDKTYDEVNRKLRADTARNELGTTMSSLFQVAPGQHFDLARVQAALPQISEHLIAAGYDPKDVAQLMNIAASASGNSDTVRRTFNMMGIDPGLDYAGSQAEAEAITRNKPITLSPNQTAIIPPPRFAPTAEPESAPETAAEGGQEEGATPVSSVFTTEQLPAPAMHHDAPEIYKQVIQDSATAHGVPPEILTETLWRESKFRQNATGAAGEQGVGQWLPSSAAQPGYGIEPFTPGQDPGVDIEKTAQYLAALKKQYGSWDAALTAYNWGSGNFDKYGIGNRPGSTKDYVTEILTNAGYDPTGQTQTAQSPEAATQPAAGAPQQQPTQVAEAPQAQQSIADVFQTGGSFTAPPAPQQEVSGGSSVMKIGPDGKPYTFYTAPKVPDATGAGGASTKVTQPNPNEDKEIRATIADHLGINIDQFTQDVLATLPQDQFNAYVKAVDDAWNTSNGNMNAAVVAGLKWLTDNYDVTPPKDTWMPFDATPLKLTPKSAPPTQAAPAAASTATTTPTVPDMPAAADRVVGQVYNTPAHGPLRWTGTPGAEWEEP